MIWVGIDPGAGGGIAAVDERGQIVMACALPKTYSEQFAVVKDLAWIGVAVAIIERVFSSPQMGVASAFSFGENYGSWRMALAAADVPFKEVLPRVWQRQMQCLSGRDKNVTKRRAMELFPGVKVTHATADAMLLAEFGRRGELRSIGA